MGISNHERSPPQVIGHSSLGTNVPKQPPQQQQQHYDAPFLEMEQEEAWRQEEEEEQDHQRQSPSKRSRTCEKHVSFATLHIREYSQVLGDHPCCTVGPPVSLGWDYTESPKVNVDAYEQSRQAQRRPRESLRLTFETRRDILAQVGASDGDVRRVQRRLSRERCCSSKAMKSFFAAEAAKVAE